MLETEEPNRYLIAYLSPRVTGQAGSPKADDRPPLRLPPLSPVAANISACDQPSKPEADSEKDETGAMPGSKNDGSLPLLECDTRSLAYSEVVQKSKRLRRRQRRKKEPLSRCLPSNLTELPKEVEAICRSSVQDAFGQHRKVAAAAASRRRRAGADARKASRDQAAAWRRQVETKSLQQEESKRRAAEFEQRTQDEQRHLEEQKAHRRASGAFGGLVSKMHRRRGVRNGEQEGSSEAETPRAKKDPNEKIAEIRRRNAQVERLQKLQEHSNMCAVAFRKDLSDLQRRVITTAFDKSDAPGDGVLGARELLEALAELGIEGGECGERHALHQLCAKVAKRHRHMTEDCEVQGGCDLYEFAMEVVPEARKRLARHIARRLEPQLEVCGRDSSGHLDFDHALQMAQRASPAFDSEVAASNELHKALRSMIEAFDRDGAAPGFFAAALQRVHERSRRRVREARRAVQDRHRLPEDLFQAFLPEILDLEQLFLEIFGRGNVGHLAVQRRMKLTREAGFLPKPEALRTRVCNLLENAESNNSGQDSYQGLAGILALLSQARGVMEAAVEQEMLSEFMHYAAHLDENPDAINKEKAQVAEENLQRIMLTLLILPDTADERDAVERALVEADPMGRSLYDLRACCRVCERASERLRLLRFQRHLRRSEDFVFSERELANIFSVFETLDEQGTDRLKLPAVREGLAKLNPERVAEISEEYFRAAFLEIDADQGGFVDLSEFMQLVTMLRDRTFLFKNPATTATTTLLETDRVDLIVLLECLGVSFHDLELKALEQSALAMHACELLRVAPGDSLEAALGAATLRELLDIGRMRHQFNRDRGSAGLPTVQHRPSDFSRRARFDQFAR